MKKQQIVGVVDKFERLLAYTDNRFQEIRVGFNEYDGRVLPQKYDVYIPVDIILAELSISRQTFYQWRVTYGVDTRWHPFKVGDKLTKRKHCSLFDVLRLLVLNMWEMDIPISWDIHHRFIRDLSYKAERRLKMR